MSRHKWWESEKGIRRQGGRYGWEVLEDKEELKKPTWNFYHPPISTYYVGYKTAEEIEKMKEEGNSGESNFTVKPNVQQQLSHIIGDGGRWTNWSHLEKGGSENYEKINLFDEIWSPTMILHTTSDVSVDLFKNFHKIQHLNETDVEKMDQDCELIKQQIKKDKKIALEQLGRIFDQQYEKFSKEVHEKVKLRKKVLEEVDLETKLNNPRVTFISEDVFETKPMSKLVSKCCDSFEIILDFLSTQDQLFGVSISCSFLMSFIIKRVYLRVHVTRHLFNTLPIEKILSKYRIKSIEFTASEGRHELDLSPHSRSRYYRSRRRQRGRRGRGRGNSRAYWRYATRETKLGEMMTRFSKLLDQHKHTLRHLKIHNFHRQWITSFHYFSELQEKKKKKKDGDDDNINNTIITTTTTTEEEEEEEETDGGLSKEEIEEREDQKNYLFFSHPPKYLEEVFFQNCNLQQLRTISTYLLPLNREVQNPSSSLFSSKMLTKFVYPLPIPIICRRMEDDEAFDYYVMHGGVPSQHCFTKYQIEKFENDIRYLTKAFSSTNFPNLKHLDLIPEQELVSYDNYIEIGHEKYDELILPFFDSIRTLGLGNNHALKVLHTPCFYGFRGFSNKFLEFLASRMDRVHLYYFGNQTKTTTTTTTMEQSENIYSVLNRVESFGRFMSENNTIIEEEKGRRRRQINLVIETNKLICPVVGVYGMNLSKSMEEIQFFRMLVKSLSKNVMIQFIIDDRYFFQDVIDSKTRTTTTPSLLLRNPLTIINSIPDTMSRTTNNIPQEEEEEEEEEENDDDDDDDSITPFVYLSEVISSSQDIKLRENEEERTQLFRGNISMSQEEEECFIQAEGLKFDLTFFECDLYNHRRIGLRERLIRNMDSLITRNKKSKKLWFRCKYTSIDDGDVMGQRYNYLTGHNPYHDFGREGRHFVEGGDDGTGNGGLIQNTSRFTLSFPMILLSKNFFLSSPSSSGGGGKNRTSFLRLDVSSTYRLKVCVSRVREFLFNSLFVFIQEIGNINHQYHHREEEEEVSKENKRVYEKQKSCLNDIIVILKIQRVKFSKSELIELKNKYEPDEEEKIPKKIIIEEEEEVEGEEEEVEEEEENGIEGFFAKKYMVQEKLDEIVQTFSGLLKDYSSDVLKSTGWKRIVIRVSLGGLSWVNFYWCRNHNDMSGENYFEMKVNE